MRYTIEYIKCDLCGTDKAKKIKTSVIFRTEQTEGRSVNPYLQIQELDICDDCLSTMMDGKQIYADGAQGHNKYYFKQEEDD